jgi:hypothetical protein
VGRKKGGLYLHGDIEEALVIVKEGKDKCCGSVKTKSEVMVVPRRPVAVRAVRESESLTSACLSV